MDREAFSFIVDYFLGASADLGSAQSSVAFLGLSGVEA